ncbi:unnamed protein product [Toxocara canis]|uniref:Major surface protein hypervariable region n=1 Tax=Toxocara canis TaxID=6265 RepID=A0A183UHF6_TOXCA|nr:unnamed protein product [Toxocara canis]
MVYMGGGGVPKGGLTSGDSNGGAVAAGIGDGEQCEITGAELAAMNGALTKIGELVLIALLATGYIINCGCVTPVDVVKVVGLALLGITYATV